MVQAGYSAADAINALHRQGLRCPRTLTVAITGTCNLTCHHCLVEAGGAGGSPPVSTETLCRLLDEYAAMGGTGVRITGGEPLCHPGWLDVLRYARGIGLRRILLQTNGVLLTDDHVRALRNLDVPGLAIQVSLDGAKAPAHDLVRGEGTFDLAVAGISRLAVGGLAGRTTIAFTEMRHNLEDFPALLHLAADLGTAAVVAGSLVTGGRGGTTPLLAPPTTAQYLRLFTRYDTDSRFRELYDAFGTMAALEWRRGDTPRVDCCTFAENPYLTADGRLYPCLLCHADVYAVTEVFQAGLSASLVAAVPRWGDLVRISRARADAIRTCRGCPGRLMCAGGCMGRALGSCGDLLAADDRCELRRTIYETTAKP